jgi:hypothetical protein
MQQPSSGSFVFRLILAVQARLLHEMETRLLRTTQGETSEMIEL